MQYLIEQVSPLRENSLDDPSFHTKEEFEFETS